MIVAISHHAMFDYLILEAPALKIHEQALSPKIASIGLSLAKVPGFLKCFGTIKLGADYTRATYTRNKSRLVSHG